MRLKGIGGRNTPVLEGSSLILGVVDADQQKRKQEMQQSQRKAESMDLSFNPQPTSPVSAHVEARYGGGWGRGTDREQAVAFPTSTVELDPVPSELFDLPYGEIRPHEPGYH